MSVSVATVVNQARDVHPGLSPAAAPVNVAYRQLTRFSRDLYENIARRVPGYLVTSANIALPLAAFPNAGTLTSLIPGGWKDLLDLVFTYSTTPVTPAQTVTAKFVPYEQRDMPQSVPAWSVEGDQIVFLGAVTDYTSFSSATLTYTPAPPMLAAPTDLVCQSGGLPDDALDCLAAMLAAFWLGRLVDDPSNAVTEKTYIRAAGEAGALRAAFLRRIWALSQRQSYRVRDVMGMQDGGAVF